MKEIIINLDNILDDEITDRRIINNYIFMYDNKVLLKKHHNSYYFIHDEDLKIDFNKELFAIKKIYNKDYPFIGDNSLTEKYFYLIKENVDIENTEWIDINSVVELLESHRYDNPRVQVITDEIIEILRLLTS